MTDPNPVPATGEIHELKTWPEYYTEVLRNRKRFELRKDDRPFKAGDILRLREWNPETQEYTGSFCDRLITYVLRDTEHLAPGYCALSLSTDPQSGSGKLPSPRERVESYYANIDYFRIDKDFALTLADELESTTAQRDAAKRLIKHAEEATAEAVKSRNEAWNAAHEAEHVAEVKTEQLTAALAENAEWKLANSRLATIANDQLDKTLLAAENAAPREALRQAANALERHVKKLCGCDNCKMDQAIIDAARALLNPKGTE